MMMICDNDVVRYEALKRSGAKTYITLLDAKVREMELSKPKKEVQPVQPHPPAPKRKPPKR